MGFTELDDMVGATVKRIFMDADNIKFETDKGDFAYEAYGDCCSYSYFYDFIGVKKLLAGRPVIKIEQVSLELDKDEEKKPTPQGYEPDVLRAYGYRFITEDPQFGEVSSVMSFRNDSNGYYGGSLEKALEIVGDLPEVTEDVLEPPERIK